MSYHSPAHPKYAIPSSNYSYEYTNSNSEADRRADEARQRVEARYQSERRVNPSRSGLQSLSGQSGHRRGASSGSGVPLIKKTTESSKNFSRLSDGEGIGTGSRSHYMNDEEEGYAFSNFQPLLPPGSYPSHQDQLPSHAQVDQHDHHSSQEVQGGAAAAPRYAYSSSGGSGANAPINTRVVEFPLEPNGRQQRQEDPHEPRSAPTTPVKNRFSQPNQLGYLTDGPQRKGSTISANGFPFESNRYDSNPATPTKASTPTKMVSPMSDRTFGEAPRGPRRTNTKSSAFSHEGVLPINERIPLAAVEEVRQETRCRPHSLNGPPITSYTSARGSTSNQDLLRMEERPISQKSAPGLRSNVKLDLPRQAVSAMSPGKRTDRNPQPNSYSANGSNILSPRNSGSVPSNPPRRSEIVRNGGGPYMPIIEDYSVNSNVFPPRAHGPRRRALSEGECQLARQGTLLTPHADSKRASAELGIMLGNSHQKAKKGKLLPQGELPIEEKMAKMDKVGLEVKKGNKARVEVDVILESDVLVEGSEIRGRLEILVKKSKKGEKIWIGGGKIRICGYEEHSSTSIRNIFYHVPFVLPTFAPYEPVSHPLFASPPNEEGFRLASEGNYSIPFRFRLPLHAGAKGGWMTGTKAPGVKYVVVGSLKLHIPEAGKLGRSISHFYRPCVVFPFVEPTSVFVPAAAPKEVSTTKALGWSLNGEKGLVKLSARVTRPIWIAGQNVWVEVVASNDSNKRIKSMQISLLRTIILYSPPKKDITSPRLDKYSTRISQKRLCEEVVEASPGAGGGYVGATGWWTGLQPGEHGTTWQMSLVLPPDCLTIARTKLIEVQYTIRVTLNSSVFVDVPIHVINFLSIDPPPSSQPPPVKALYVGSPLGKGLAIAYQEPIPANQSAYEARQPDNLVVSGEPGNRRNISSKHYSQPFSLDMDYYENTPDLSRTHRHTMTPLEQEPLAPLMPPILPSPRPDQPENKRADTQDSYLAMVASPAGTEENMTQVEEYRRQGRQMSLAAIAQDFGEGTGDGAISMGADSYQQSAIESQIDFRPSNFSSIGIHSPAIPQDEIEEIQLDLDAIGHDVEGSQHECEHTEDFGRRDAESRLLEMELAEEHEYHSRYASKGQDEEEERVSHPVAKPVSSDPMENDGGEEPMDEETPQLTKDRWAHIAKNRSSLGSSSPGLSNAESDIGEVVNAIRRDLTILRESRKGTVAGGQSSSASRDNALNRFHSTASRSQSMDDVFHGTQRPSTSGVALREPSLEQEHPIAARQRLEDRMKKLNNLASRKMLASEDVPSLRRKMSVVALEPPAEEPELTSSTLNDSASEDSPATTPTLLHREEKGPEPCLDVDWGAKARPSLSPGLRKSVSDVGHNPELRITRPASPASLGDRTPLPPRPPSSPLGPRNKSSADRFDLGGPSVTEAMLSPRRSIIPIPEDQQLRVPVASSPKRTRKSHTSILGARAQSARLPQATTVMLRSEVEDALRQRRTSLNQSGDYLERKKSTTSIMSAEETVSAAEHTMLQHGEENPFTADEPMWRMRPKTPIVYSEEESDGLL